MGYARDTWRLSRLLRPYRDQVDLIHVNRVGCEIQSIAAKLAGFKRVVTTIHNLPGEAEKNNWVCRWVERLSFACGDVHIAVSEATYEEWHERVGLEKKETIDHRPETIDRRDKGANASRSKVYGLWSMVFSHQPRGKGVVIYNGMDPVDLTGFDRRAYRQQFCDDPEHVFIIGICARLHRMKGHVVLLEAFASLLKEQLLGCSVDKLLSNYPEVSPSITTQQPNNPTTIPLLLIAGSGPERPNLEAKIAELGIGNHVRLLGHRTDAERFAASLDLNVLPSVELESFGYSVVEAMFAGVPSIVSDVGGMKELVAASGGGIILRAGDVSALVQAIEFYINNPAERKQAGEQAQTYARRELGAGRMASATLKTYFAVADNV
jgi:glycosyltransferase involved in cell wall biosynthesis